MQRSLIQALDENEQAAQDIRARRLVLRPVLVRDGDRAVILRPIIYPDMLPHGMGMRGFLHYYGHQAALPFTGLDAIINACTNGVALYEAFGSIGVSNAYVNNNQARSC